MLRILRAFLISCFILSAFLNLNAQGFRPGPPPERQTRSHKVTQSNGIVDLVPANKSPITSNRVQIEVVDGDRVINANGIPAHLTGRFPNRGNPHRIEIQNNVYTITAKPRATSDPTPIGHSAFGVAINGVVFDPGAAEFYMGDRRGGWQYEALSGAVPLGVDQNHAHVQPNGAYHYHGLPTLLLQELAVDGSDHSALVGWAADGFPIYALYGYDQADNSTSGVKILQPSYRLKKGKRPSGKGEPGGVYDGTFVADYEYVIGLGDLDECNGRYCVTPDFPRGTYAYFLTETWPVIPRFHMGTASADFKKRRRHPPR